MSASRAFSKALWALARSRPACWYFSNRAVLRFSRSRIALWVLLSFVVMVVYDATGEEGGRGMKGKGVLGFMVVALSSFARIRPTTPWGDTGASRGSSVRIGHPGAERILDRALATTFCAVARVVPVPGREPSTCAFRPITAPSSA